MMEAHVNFCKKDIILKQFKSVKRIAEADEKDLERVVGHSRAKKIKAYYNSK